MKTKIRFSESKIENRAYRRLSENIDDYISVTIRLLSSTIIGGETPKATFFSEDVLKSSMHLLPNLSVFSNGIKIGYIERVEWSESTIQNGVQIPGGINAVCAIDYTEAPQLLRTILTGAGTSNAVTLEFDFDESHEIEDFAGKIGRYDEAKNMFCMVANEITEYIDIAFDFRTLDPFGRVFDKNGDLQNIDTKSIFNYSKPYPTKAQIDERRLKDVELN